MATRMPDNLPAARESIGALQVDLEFYIRQGQCLKAQCSSLRGSINFLKGKQKEMEKSEQDSLRENHGNAGEIARLEAALVTAEDKLAAASV